MSIVALDDFSTSRLIGTDHVPVVFGIELADESVVESTRSQNITVSWRRSASGERGSGGEWLQPECVGLLA